VLLNQVGEPFEFGGNFGEVAELGGGEWASDGNRTRVCDWNQVLFHAAAGQCSLAALLNF
jgi:hypothetical protein